MSREGYYEKGAMVCTSNANGSQDRSDSASCQTEENPGLGPASDK